MKDKLLPGRNRELKKSNENEGRHENFDKDMRRKKMAGRSRK